MSRSRSSKRTRKCCSACGTCNTTLWREHKMFGEIYTICDNCHREKQARSNSEVRNNSKARTPPPPLREPPAKKSPRPLRKSPRLSPAVSKSAPQKSAPKKSPSKSPSPQAHGEIHKPDPALTTVSELEINPTPLVSKRLPTAPNTSDQPAQSSTEKCQIVRVHSKIDIPQSSSQTRTASDPIAQNNARSGNDKRKVWNDRNSFEFSFDSHIC